MITSFYFGWELEHTGGRSSLGGRERSKVDWIREYPSVDFGLTGKACHLDTSCVCNRCVDRAPCIERRPSPVAALTFECDDCFSHLHDDDVVSSLDSHLNWHSANDSRHGSRFSSRYYFR